MKRFLWLLLTVICIAFIFYNSSLVGDTSSQASNLLATWLAGALQLVDISISPKQLNIDLRTLAHFCEFAMLGICLLNLFSEWRIGRRSATGYIFFIGLAVAVLDEYIQLLTPGREGRLADVGLDFCGIFFVWLCAEVWSWSKH